ncbi:MAG: hypothetical protein O7F73_05730 [Gammaproteobacteria bacterium]|nr:hypothetical protein [Gammaproteobacteria bacterium]
MKPPWYQHGEDAELEALQTDVMRFIAILGLCLAAIFSLAQSGAEKNDTPESRALQSVAAPLVQESKSMPAARAIATPTPAGTARQVSAHKATATPARGSAPSPVSTIASAPPPRGIGFSLEFVSDAALLRLLESGQLRLFAKVDGHHWVLDSGNDNFTETAAPGSYYRMLAATVPASLRRNLLRAAAASAGEWGVQLTPSMVDQLQRIMGERAGGSLVIQPDGGIRVELAEKDPGAWLSPGS